jgi:uncharacterized NAD(P)/FAD-binding protein YdhS
VPLPRKHVIIVGGGASGVLLACHLLRDKATLRVALIEKRRQIGRGIAYSTCNPNHLLNIRAANMSAFADDPDHFWRWLSERRASSDEIAGIPACNDPFCFVPRTIYGDYIAELVQPLLAKNEHDTGLHIVQGECLSVGETRSGVVVRLVDGDCHLADMAVLATGNDATPPCGGCYADPWTLPADSGITPDAKVFILGTALSMVDYVLALLLAGHRGPIVALSRRGLLPHGHRRAETFQFRESDVPFGSSLPELFRWLRICARIHASRRHDWRGVIDGLRPYTQRLWKEMSFKNRRQFNEHARAWWDVHRHRMAPEVETRINEAIRSGQLEIIAGKIDAIEPGDAGAVVRFRRRSKATLERMYVSKIIECRAGVVVPPASVNPVLCNLFAKGLARSDPLRLGLDVTPECELIDQYGIASTQLYAVGPLTRAQFWEIVAIPDIRSQCAQLASLIRHRLVEHPPTPM